MTTTWEKVKQLYLYLSKIQHKLIPPVVLLLLVVIVVRWMTRSPPGLVLHGGPEEESIFERLQDKEIESTINRMADVRSETCKGHAYDGIKEDKISIILDFKDHQFYDLKMTMESIIKHTPSSLYEEVIILDDGSSHTAIIKEAAAYLGHERFRSKLRAFRSDKSDGSVAARFKAAKMAKGSILVFLSNHVLVNTGWLEPLVKLIQEDRHNVAIPHADALLSDYRFYPTPENYTNTFTWDLRVVTLETLQQGEVLNTPVMTGKAFAMDKQFLEDLGHLDDHMEPNGGGDALELSFRVWMCGGALKVHTCSRVAVRNAMKPLEVTVGKNFRRITELWLGDNRQFAYRQGKFDFEAEDDSERFQLRSRQSLMKQAECKTFPEYMSWFQGEVHPIPEKSRYYGKLRSDTGRCASIHTTSAGKVSMRLCRQWLYENDMMLALDISGRLRHGDLCFEMIESKEVYALPCAERSLNKATQLWQFSSTSGLVQSAFNTDLCLAHLTDSLDKSHYVGIQPCSDSARENLWQFVKY